MLGFIVAFSKMPIICFDYSHPHDPLSHICCSSNTPKEHFLMMVTQYSSPECAQLTLSLLQLLIIDFWMHV